MGLKQFDIQQKILGHKKALLDWLNREVVYPITVEIDPSNACNEKCIWCCWEEHRRDGIKMSESLLKKIILNLGRIGVKGINWTGGGEPLANKYTVKSMGIARKLNIQNGLFTNGLLAGPKVASDLIKYCEWIRISLGAATPETFERCHGVKGFDKVIRNIKGLVRAKKNLRENTTLGISMLVTKENYHELYDEALLAKQLGVDYFQGKPLVQIGSEDKEWWNKKVDPLFRKAKSSLENSDFKILVAQYTKDKYGKDGIRFRDNSKDCKIGEIEKGDCYVHNFVTAITSEGNLVFCKNLRDKKEFILGNLNNQTFEEIWCGDKRKKIMEKINKEGCSVFCQNNHMNKALRYLYQLHLEGASKEYLDSIKPLDRENHPNFL